MTRSLDGSGLDAVFIFQSGEVVASRASGRRMMSCGSLLDAATFLFGVGI